MTPAAEDSLPTLPEVHLRALDACRRDDSYKQVSKIIRQDASLTGRILALANAPAFRAGPAVQSVDQALMTLGTERLQHLILTAALQQVLFEMGQGHWQRLQGFWRDALAAAILAQALARLTRFPDTEQAFIGGLLHNAGELLRLREELAGRRIPEADTGELSARLALTWGLPEALADAIRQAGPGEPKAGMSRPHLDLLLRTTVVLVNSDAEGLLEARQLFGLNEELTAELLWRGRDEVRDLAEALGLPAPALYDGNDGTRRLTTAAVREALRQLPATPPESQRSENTGLQQQVHEINNPLTIVRQYIFQLRKQLTEPGQQDDIDVIDEELARAAGLLASLANLPAAERLPDGPELSCDLCHEIRSLGRLMENGLLRDTGATLALSLPAEPCQVRVPGTVFRQVLLNLLRNAAESADHVEIAVSVTAPVLLQGRNWAEVSVRDNGPGLPEPVRTRLFEPVTSGKGGSHAGLGLSIVKQLTDDMEGMITCQSGTDGTCFRVLLPMATKGTDSL